MRLIDADALANVIETECPVLNFAALLSKGWVLSLIRDKANTPTVEPKRGRWVEDDHILVCSECECVAMQRVYYNLTHNATDIQMVKTPYCPHCGAKMEGSETDGR